MAGNVAAMPRPATGSIDPYPHRDGRTITYRIRVRAYGQRYRVTLGTNHEGWGSDRARVELDGILEQIQRGTWRPPGANSGEYSADYSGRDAAETVHVFLSRWWARKQRDVAEKTRLDYQWRIAHILDHLAHHQVAELDAATVDDLRDELAAAGLGPRATNMVLGLLAQALDDAVDYGILAANPARGRNRRMREPRGRRTFLEPEQTLSLLAAAGEWEASLQPSHQLGRRAIVALMALGALRIGEVIALDRRDLDLKAGRLHAASKTDAGDREVELTAFLHDALSDHVATAAALPDEGPGGRPLRSAGPLFPSLTGRRLSPENIRRTLRGACERAGIDYISPHGLRRTAISLMVAAGRDPRWIMGQVGHTDPALTLRIYAQILARRQQNTALIWTLMRFADEEEDRA